MSVYETPEMNIMLYARNTGTNDGGTCIPGTTAMASGDDAVGTSGDVGGIGGAYDCENIAPSNCSDGRNWNTGGCISNGGGSGGFGCDNQVSSAGGKG